METRRPPFAGHSLRFGDLGRAHFSGDTIQISFRIRISAKLNHMRALTKS